MPTTRKREASIAESLPNKSVKMSSEEPHTKATAQVADLRKAARFPTFALGRDIGYFAIAIQDDANNDASDPDFCSSWFSTYQLDEMEKASYEDRTDWLGVLVAAALCNSDDNKATKRAIQFVAFNASQAILDCDWNIVDTSILEKVNLDRRSLVEESWDTCRKLQHSLTQAIQHVSLNAINDFGIKLDICRLLWRIARKEIQDRKAPRSIVSNMVKVLPPSKFKENFALFRSAIEESGSFDSASTGQWCLESLPQLQELKASDFDGFIDSCTVAREDWDFGNELKYAPDYVENAIIDLRNCIDERDRAVNQAKELTSRLRFTIECNKDLLDSEAQRMTQNLG